MMMLPLLQMMIKITGYSDYAVLRPGQHVHWSATSFCQFPEGNSKNFPKAPPPNTFGSTKGVEQILHWQKIGNIGFVWHFQVFKHHPYIWNNAQKICIWQKSHFQIQTFFLSHCLLCGHKDPILIFLFEKVNEIFFNFFFSKCHLTPFDPWLFWAWMEYWMIQQISKVVEIRWYILCLGMQKFNHHPSSKAERRGPNADRAKRL